MNAHIWTKDRPSLYRWAARSIVGLGFSIAVFFLFACSPAPVATPNPSLRTEATAVTSATPLPSADTPVPPTFTPSPTGTPTSTPTELPTSIPTDTPVPTATATNTPSPTATSIPPTATRRPQTATAKPKAVSYSCPAGQAGLVVRNSSGTDATVNVEVLLVPPSGDHQVPKGSEVLMCSDLGEFMGFMLWTVKFAGQDQPLTGMSMLDPGQIDLLNFTGVPPACGATCYVETTLQAGQGAGPLPTFAPKYPLPPGKGGLVVHNYYGQDMTFTINNQQYTVPANGEQFITLDPGTYPWSAFIPGQGQAHGSATIVEGQISGQNFAAR